MADTQKPANWLNMTEMFDFGTVTGQNDPTTTQIDLSDPTVNLSIADYANNTYPGRARVFANGMIKKDTELGVFYLTGDTTKNNYLTFTQSADDVSAGTLVSMPLEGEQLTYSRPPTPSNLRVRPSESDDNLELEKQAIEQAYAQHGHNSYAYSPHQHPDYSSIPEEHKLDIGDGPGVVPLKQGDGIFTTRMFDLIHEYSKSQPARGYLQQFTGGLTREQAREASNQYGYWWYGYRSNNGTTQTNLPRIDSLNGSESFLPVYESDGVTLDRQATFFAQQQHWKNARLGYINSIKNTNYPTGMRGMHYTMSMSVKLGDAIQAGEYVPVCFIDRIDGIYRRIMNNNLDDYAGANEDLQQRVADLKTRVAQSTGTDENDADYWKHLCQYFTLTSNHLHTDRRSVKDLVMYIGKPHGGNALGGQYEFVVWASGSDIYFPYSGYRWIGRGFGRRGQRYSATANKSNVPRMIKIPVDDRSNTFDPGSWNPLFFHFVSNEHTYDMVAGYSLRLKPGHFRHEYMSTGGVAVGAFGPGIMDFEPGFFDRSDLGTASSRRNHYARNPWPYGGGYVNAGNFRGSRLNEDMYMVTTLAPAGKITGVANVNMHVFRDNWQVPTSAGQEDDQRNVTYFPQRTTGYEAIGFGSDLENTGQASWQDVDFIVDSSLETAAAAFGLGEEHVLEIKTKAAPGHIHSQLNDDSIVKELVVEVRGVEKKYLNPGLRLKYGLWDYTDPETPVQVSKIVSVSPERIGEKNSSLSIVADLQGEKITYKQLNSCRLRVWADG